MFDRLFRLACCAGSVALVALAQGAAAAEKYPDHAIELVVPYAPGGSTDAMARRVAIDLAEVLKVPIVVTNRNGAGGAIGTGYGLQTNDGYRLVAAGNTNLGPMLIVGPKLGYSLESISGLGRAIVNPLVLVAKKGRFASFDAFLKEAREKPDEITFASWGPRTPSHFYGEIVAQSAKVKLRHIPYDSGSKAMLAAMGGQVDVAVVTSATAKAGIAGGTLSGLLVSTDYRLKDLPDVESVKALGYPGAVYSSFDGFVTSSKLPPDRLKVLREAFDKVLSDQMVQASLRDLGAESGYMPGPAYEEFLRQNQVKLREIASKVKMED